AATGKIIGTAKRMAHQVKSQSSGVIDGFMRKPEMKISIAKKPATPQPKKVAVNARLEKPVKKRPIHSAHKLHPRIARSKTLMRNAVTRPSDRFKVTQSQPANYSHHATPANPGRLSRAQKIATHAKVSRFGGFSKSAKSEPQIITPERVKVVGKTPEPSVSMRTSSATAPSAARRPLPSMMTSASHNQLERLLDHALAKADAHKQILRGAKANRSLKERLKSIPKPLIITLAVLIVGLVAGFLAWQNVPQVAVKIASLRTGITAAVPGYVPSGFEFDGPVSTGQKSVSIRYQSVGDPALSFTLTQKTSNMDSESLAAQAIPADSQVQTSQVDGSTVFLHGRNNDATWVNRGIWYTIDNDASLSSNQLLRVVESL
ncbi:MAG: hypothetical protein WD887_01545, partial [Candidatus Saccharimonadales bacterium]